MSKRSTKPLYELLHDKNRAARRLDAEGEQRIQPPPPAAEAEAAAAAEGLGRIVRIPIGYFYVGGGIAIAVLILVYSFGVRQGRNAAEAEFQASLDRGTIIDPAAESGSGRTPETTDPGGAFTPNTRIQPESGGTQAENRRPNLPSGDVPLERDTRIRGLNYIVVEQFETDEAYKVAAFLRERGVDVMLLPTNNPRLLRVVTRTGFDGWGSNAEAQSLHQRIKDLGRTWKRQADGTKDFSQSFPQKYQ